MPMYSRHKPNQAQLLILELRKQLAAYKEENLKLRKSIEDSIFGLEYARKKLIEKEEENRQLKLIILRMEESEAKDG